MAARLGIPACAGHELTGMYGLEMRTVTAAINAGILPRALATADVVDASVRRVAPDAPLLVMRGDGGAADVRTMRRHPLLTAFSGPAASVAGALRHTGLLDGIVVEVGGTSTNVSIVKGGRPVLAYVRVLDHLTCVRSLDVRVAGIGGGSMLRIERRWGRSRIADVGPRSAHIAGLPYATFTDAARLDGAVARLVAPREGDPAEYAILESPSGERFAITLTCAANAVDGVPAGAYAAGDPASARARSPRWGGCSVSRASASRSRRSRWRLGRSPPSSTTSSPNIDSPSRTSSASAAARGPSFPRSGVAGGWRGGSRPRPR